MTEFVFNEKVAQDAQTALALNVDSLNMGEQKQMTAVFLSIKIRIHHLTLFSKPGLHYRTTFTHRPLSILFIGKHSSTY